ncbi:ATP-grasp domain-containing protein [Embleya sp. NBC_00896]|uniref:ATP-grasp domain-containing protein n=1 Tax=Embleya sp. NBC_00896 TaxID=2975961 RepID=UPI00386AB1E7|nr:ATP-grasp domain-containing protein [Embleya sp. NBC_00896]
MSTTLALSPQTSTTADCLARAARARGLAVAVLTGPRADLRGTAAYYGGPRFAETVVDSLDVALLEPADDWLPTLPERYTRRTITPMTMAEARRGSTPMFVKPPSDKSFEAAVYADGSRLPSAVSGETPVLVSEIRTFVAEYRLFVLAGEVHTGSRYARFGRLDPLPLDADPRAPEVAEFAADLLGAQAARLPGAVVVDVGLSTTADTAEEHWAVVEPNMAWFSNIYAADPARCLDVVLASAGPAARVSRRDRAFVRAPIRARV